MCRKKQRILTVVYFAGMSVHSVAKHVHAFLDIVCLSAGVADRFSFNRSMAGLDECVALARSLVDEPRVSFWS